MSLTTIEVAAPRERVYAVLADPYRYPEWVVGTRSVRDADERFPEPGARFSARVGTGPVSVDAVTTVLEREEPARLVLRTRARRVGAAQIELDLQERGTATLVTLRERALGDPVSRFAQTVSEPLLASRNRRSLQRLKELVERSA